MVQGQELDRIFADNSAEISDDRIEEDDPYPGQHKDIIGHVRTAFGVDLAELVLKTVSQAILGKGITTSRRIRLACSICGQILRNEKLFLEHARSHQDNGTTKVSLTL
jgi:hypothetical protein